MKTFATIIAVAFATGALAAPAAVEKRDHTQDFTLTFYTEKNYKGDKLVVPVHFKDEQDQHCVTNFIGKFAATISSLTLSEEEKGIFCRLNNATDCKPGEKYEQPWFFDKNITDLSYNPDNGGGFDNQARSVWCSPRSH